MTTNTFIQVQTTTADRAEAERIASALVERRVAACVQIVGPIRSYYRWKERLESSEEWLCIAKTLSDRYKDAEHAIRELHSYETPEIIAVPITSGSDDYLSWLRDQL